MNTVRWVLALLVLTLSLTAQEPGATPAELTNLGDVMRLEESDATALPFYDAALELDPNFVPALLSRGRLHADNERYSSARHDADRCLQLDPDNMEARLLRGELYVHADRMYGARRAFAAVVEAHPDEPRALAWLGYVHQNLDDHDKAVEVLEKAYRLNGQDAWTAGIYGYSLWALDRLDPATEVMERAVELEPEDAWTRDMLSTIYRERGQADLAVRWYRMALEQADAAIALDAGVAGYHASRALALQELGRESEAEASWRQAAVLDPSNYGGELGAGGVYEEGDVAEALAGLLILLFVYLVILSCIGLVVRGGALHELRTVPAGHTPVEFDGKVGDLYGLYFKNLVLTVVTFGIYKFWAKVEMRRYEYQHSRFADGRFDYHATGKEKFVGFLKGMVLLIPLVVLLYVVFALLPETWVYEDKILLVWAMFVLVFYLLRPLILVGAKRFNLSRTSWNNLRFHFTGTVRDAWRLYLRDGVLMVLTLGVYWFWHKINVRRFATGHTKLGELGFVYRGEGSMLFGLELHGRVLAAISLGFYLPWHIARIHRFHVENVSLRGRRFRSRLTGGMVIAHLFPAMLAVVVTFGLALPWALHRWLRLKISTTSYADAFDGADLTSFRDAAASPVLEGVGEAGGALEEIGDLFGI